MMAAPGVSGNFLALDIGGTKVEAALAALKSGRLESFKTVRVATGDHGDFGGVMAAVMRGLEADEGLIKGAAVAVAGPVVGGACR